MLYLPFKWLRAAAAPNKTMTWQGAQIQCGKCLDSPSGGPEAKKAAVCHLMVLVARTAQPTPSGPCAPRRQHTKNIHITHLGQVSRLPYNVPENPEG